MIGYIRCLHIQADMLDEIDVYIYTCWVSIFLEIDKRNPHDKHFLCKTVGFNNFVVV